MRLLRTLALSTRLGAILASMGLVFMSGGSAAAFPAQQANAQDVGRPSSPTVRVLPFTFGVQASDADENQNEDTNDADEDGDEDQDEDTDEDQDEDN